MWQYRIFSKIPKIKLLKIELVSDDKHRIENCIVNLYNKYCKKSSTFARF